MNKKNLPYALLMILSVVIISSCGKEENNENKLDTPTLISPANNTVVKVVQNLGGYETLDWSDVLNATEYEYQLSNDRNFGTVLHSRANSYSSGTAGHVLFTKGTTCYWRVRALAPGFENSDFTEPFALVIE